MPVPWGPLIGGAADVIGGLFGKSGQQSANAANARIAAENRDWQERMSNTAHQRATVDLEKAGLNRILALGQPASTPAGNIATMQNVNEPLQKGISAAGMTAAQIAQIRAQTKYIDAQRRALEPKAVLGDTIKDTVDTVKDSWGDLQNRFGEKGIIARATEKVQSAKDKAVHKRFDNMAEGMGLTPSKAERRLIEFMKTNMDLPKMSDTDYLRWAYENQDKILAAYERQRKYQ